MEDLVGTIEVGKKADLAVLDQNILTCDPKKISDSTVRYTISDGRIVHEGEPHDTDGKIGTSNRTANGNRGAHPPFAVLESGTRTKNFIILGGVSLKPHPEEILCHARP